MQTGLQLQRKQKQTIKQISSSINAPQNAQATTTPLVWLAVELHSGVAPLFPLWWLAVQLASGVNNSDGTC